MNTLKIGMIVVVGYMISVSFGSFAAKTASQVFHEAQASIVLVQVSNASGTIISTGSGVVVAYGRVVTNCHVVRSGPSIAIRFRGKWIPSHIELADDNLDICHLRAPDLQALPVKIAPLQSVIVGASVYAIGSPRGLELTISDGIVSGIRKFNGESVIQTTAPISPGSSGGGLFDEEARLIGITTFYLVDGQNLNFAVPAEIAISIENSSRTRTRTIDEHRQHSLKQIMAVHKLIEQGKYPEAAQMASQWTESQPTNPFAWFFLGEAYEKQQISTRSIAAYKKAIQFDPSYTAAWTNMGNVYLSNDSIDLARQAYEEALVADPLCSDAYVGLGRIRLKSEDRTGALNLYEQAVRVSLESGFPNYDALYAFCILTSITEFPDKKAECSELSKAAKEIVDRLLGK